MVKVIKTNLDDLSKGEFHRISLGLKPSGEMHFGTLMTFLQGMVALSKNPDTSLDVAVMDLDFDFQRGKDYVSFMYSHDSMKCHGFMKEHTMREAEDALAEMSRFFGVNNTRIRTRYFSETTLDPTYQKFMEYLFLQEEGMQLLKKSVTPLHTTKTRQLISPICDECGHSSSKLPTIYVDNSIMSRGTVKGKCFNERCDVGEYFTHINQSGRINFFYLVDPVRDLIPDGDGHITDLHIFGGDYALPWGGGDRASKAERVLRLMEGLSPIAPSTYVGPILMDGEEKVSKSTKNGYTLSSLRERVPNWVQRFYSVLVNNPQSQILDVGSICRDYGIGHR
jgi:hypothetical protein